MRPLVPPTRGARWRARAGRLALAAAGALGGLNAQAETPDETPMLDALVRGAQERLTLNDPQAHPLRAQLHTLVQAQLLALRPVYAQWLQQSKAEAPTLSNSGHFARLAARQRNAHAWMMAAASGVALADASVRGRARWCEPLARLSTWYELRVRLLEDLPPAQWPAALVLERQALALLAQPPAASTTASAASPETPASADTPVALAALAPALQALRQEQQAGGPPAWPLPPGLIAPVLGQLEAPVLAATQRCRLAQWWWQHPAAASTSDAGRLMTLALQGDGIEQLGLRAGNRVGEDDGPYPRAALRLDLQGVVRVQWAVPPPGQLAKPQVVSRRLRVANWPDAVAPGLINLLDEASVQQGLQVANGPPRADATPPKQGLVQQEFLWKLE